MDTLKITDKTILDCGHKPSAHSKHTTGYGQCEDGKVICYNCCAVRDKQTMIDSGRSCDLPLYLHANLEVTNWPGTLRFRVTNIRKGYHNIGRTRTDVWFNGPDGFVWHGVQIGEFNAICHAKRTKQRA
jgi:hypothetical protein